MDFRAHLSYLRIAPRKVRLLAGFLTGRRVPDALAQLSVTVKRSSEPLRKLIASAVANANRVERKADDLVIRAIRVNEGPKLKRFRPRAFGRAAVILKRSSHVTIVLTDEKANASSRPTAGPTDPKPSKTPASPKTHSPKAT